jgi:DnaJ-class molecular chaperone
MGLAAFRSGDGLSCPKCHSSGLQKRYHEMVIMSMGDEMHPCQEWVQKGLLQGQVGEHLCLRCQGCGYGFPMKTADT